MKLPEFLTITPEGIRATNAIDLVPGDDPILKEVMPEFNFGYNNDAIATANLLIDALKKHKGLGISANQIGMRRRCFVAGMDTNIVAYFNPKIVGSSKEEDFVEEGCLSYPGLFVKIRRPISIRLTYQDYEGNLKDISCTGMTARILQHEVDHLNGITINERAGKFALQIAKKKMNRKRNKK